jgi:hypothetical protein
MHVPWRDKKMVFPGSCPRRSRTEVRNIRSSSAMRSAPARERGRPMRTGPLSSPTSTRGKSPRRIERALKWRGSRDILFWLLLRGSWQFLAAPRRRNGFVGCAGTAVFLIFARVSLDRLRELGLELARWRSVRGVFWLASQSRSTPALPRRHRGDC